MPEPATGGALRGLVVLVTRPAAQAGTLCRLIEAEGGTALRLPLIEIAPVADEPAAARRLAAARRSALWIFSSTNAVEQAARLAPPPWPPCAAVGVATAAALHALGCAGVLVPEAGDGAAALLARAELAGVAGQRIATIGGEQPLPLLEEALRARGAIVEVIPVYRRVAVAQAPDDVARALAKAAVIVVASAEALRHLHALTPPSARAQLLARPLVLPSRRVVETARELGFGLTPQVPQQVSDAGFVEVLRGLAPVLAQPGAEVRSTDSP